MKSHASRLDDHLIRDRKGHLTELGVTVLADGELDLLSSEAVLHAEDCPTCGERVGQSALSALVLADALGAELLATSEAGRAAPACAPIAGRQPFPVALLLAALAAAILGLLPSAGGALTMLQRFPLLLWRTSPALARVSVLLFRRLSQNQTLTAIGLLSALGFVLGGVVIARLDARAMRTKAEKGAA
jgi:hypothetical protein